MGGKKVWLMLQLFVRI